MPRPTNWRTTRTYAIVLSITATSIAATVLAHATAQPTGGSAPSEAELCRLQPKFGVTSTADVIARFGEPTGTINAQNGTRGLWYVYSDETMLYFYVSPTDRLIAVARVIAGDLSALPSCWERSLFSEPTSQSQALEDSGL
jgi:hypothetical protein